MASQPRKDTTTKSLLSAALIASLALGGFLFLRLQETETRNANLFVSLQASETRNATLNRHLEKVAKDLTKEKTDVEATLAECNATLADVQAKAAPLCPALPPAPAPIVCPPAPPAIACPLVPAAAEPATIATPVPKVIHKRPHLHRHHVAKPAPLECRGEPK
jgi:hypothetical protein